MATRAYRWLAPESDRHEVRDCGYETPCWVWTGNFQTHGYGTITVDGKGRVAHRFRWEKVNGPVPDGLELDHLCRNRACVNLDHLEPVTHAENVRRGACTKLSEDDVREIRRSLPTERADLDLAVKFGMSCGYIRAVRTGRARKNVS